MARRRNILGWMTAVLTFVFLLPLSAAPVYATPDELDQIRQEIKARGARWHADKTSVSELTWKEKKLRLGADENEDLAADIFSSTETAPIPMVTASPATLDWRNVEGVSYVSPVKNQGSCGSCWAFATTAALESQVMIDTAGMPVDLSEQILVSCSGTGTCSGGSAASASNYIRDVGLPLESCFTYTATNNLCSNACPNWQESTYSITGWHRASTTAITAEDIKNALYAYGPMIATMYVYNDFYSYRSGVYSYTTGSYAGAHAVMVLGYDDTLQAFIVKNSWGSGWGEAGYFMIAYSEVTGTSKFGYSTMVYDGYGKNPPSDTTAPSATITSPVSGATVSGTATVNVSASDNVGVTSVGLYLDGVLLGTDSATPFTFAWNTSTTSNGLHNLKAVAYDAAGNSGASTAVSITVSNVSDTTPPTVTITSPANGARVSKVVKVKVSAADNSALKRLEAYVDGKLLGAAACSASSCSASFNWNAGSGVARGQHTITAYAYDTASNKGSAAVTVYK